MFNKDVAYLAMGAVSMGINLVSGFSSAENSNWRPIVIPVVEPFSMPNDGVPWTNTSNMTPHEYSFWMAFKDLHERHGFGYLMNHPDHFIETQPAEEQERYRAFRELPETQRFTRIKEELMQSGSCNVTVMYDPMVGESYFILV